MNNCDHHVEDDYTCRPCADAMIERMETKLTLLKEALTDSYYELAKIVKENKQLRGIK